MIFCFSNNLTAWVRNIVNSHSSPLETLCGNSPKIQEGSGLTLLSLQKIYKYIYLAPVKNKKNYTLLNQHLLAVKIPRLDICA